MASFDPALDHAVLGLVVNSSDLFEFLMRMPNFVSVVQAAEPQPDDSTVLIEGAKRLANEYRVLVRVFLAWLRPGRDFFLVALHEELDLGRLLLHGPRDLRLSCRRLDIVVFGIRVINC